MKTDYRNAVMLLAGVALGGLAVQGLHAQAKPPVYYISEIDVHDVDAYAKDYAPRSQALIKRPEGASSPSEASPATWLESSPHLTATLQNA